MKDMDRLEVDIGRLLCRKMRDTINRMRFMGHNIRFWESSGWLSHTFIIEGAPQSIRNVRLVLDGWKYRLELPIERKNEG